MKRMNRFSALCVALIGSAMVTASRADTKEIPTLAPASSAELSQLAAELADTAAKLAKLQDSRSPAQKATTTSETKTTVHWLSSDSSALATDATIDIEIEPSVSGDVVQAGATAPRPAAVAYKQAPLALPSPTNSKIIRAQANEDVFYPDPAGQSLSEGEQDDLATPANDMPWGDPVMCSDGCCDDCCDVCCEATCGCAKCPPRRILVVGTEVVFLDVDLNGNRIAYQFDDFDTPSVTAFGPAYGDGAIDDFYITPRLWVGVQGEKWGVIGRYFHMRVGENDHDPFDPFGPVGEQSFDVNSIFEAYYTDLELTRNFCVHGCKTQFSFGARYASIEHDENIYARTIADDATYTGYGRANRQASGTGLTFGLNGRKPLFCNSCAHWFYNVRSSILWGTILNETETEATADVTPDFGSGAITGAAVSVDDDLFIGEVQLGLEWDFALRCLPAKSFFRAAFEYQYWDAATGSASSGAFAGFSGATNSQVAVDASAPGLIVDLLGVSIGTGFTW